MTHCDAIWTLTLGCRFGSSSRRSNRSQIVPMLILHSNTYPIKLVIEVLVSVVHPSPDLLLDIASTLISSTTSKHKICVEEGNSTTFSWRHPHKLVDSTRLAYKKLPGNIRFGGTRMSSKKSRRTECEINIVYHRWWWKSGLILFMPNSEALLICPMMISPLNGRKTMRRNSTACDQQ